MLKGPIRLKIIFPKFSSKELGTTMSGGGMYAERLSRTGQASSYVEIWQKRGKESRA